MVLADETAHTGLLVQVMDQVRLAGVNDIAVCRPTTGGLRMFGRAAVSGLAGLIIAVLLFLTMHVLIARSQGARSYPDAYPIVDFVRLAPEAQPPPRDEAANRPRNPTRPKVPPTPSLTLQTANQPQLPAPQIEMAAAITSGPLLDMTPLAAPARQQANGPVRA